LAGYALELALLGFKPVLFAVITVVAIASSLTNFMMTENRRKNVALRHSREEMHRMARVAERERIGRDLHDLLGHTLSLIALKSELAAKLLDRDRAAAAREIADVTSIARDALIETTLAMIVREAVTNIQRHSGAREARIEVLTEAVASGRSGEADGKKVEERVAWLRVNDNGRGGITSCGNGLQGIGERVRSLGGTLEIDSPRGKGTTLRVRLPLRGPLVGPAAGVTPAGKTGAMAVPDAPGQASAAMVRT
jgi:two-component system sensor histidine kinase DesK